MIHPSSGTRHWREARVDWSSLPLALRLLRATIGEPWESVNQVVADHGQAELGDPLREGTAAWHLRHIVEIFRLHARTVMSGLGDGHLEHVMPSPDAPIPLGHDAGLAWSPAAVRDELLADVDRFAEWLLAQPPEVLERQFSYGSPTDLTCMFSVMLQHITWHAAAVHFHCRWNRGRRGSST